MRMFLKSSGLRPSILEPSFRACVARWKLFKEKDSFLPYKRKNDEAQSQCVIASLDRFTGSDYVRKCALCL